MLDDALQQVNWTKYYLFCSWSENLNVYNNVFLWTTFLKFPDSRNKNLTLGGSIVCGTLVYIFLYKEKSTNPS